MDEEKKQKRLRYVDIFKAAAILLVVFHHTMSAWSLTESWFASFGMSGWFFISGLLLKTYRNANVKTSLGYIGKRFLSLMLPYFLWAIFYTGFTIPNLLKIAYGSHSTLSKAGSLTSLWFLPVLFLCQVFYAACNCILRDKFTRPVKLVLTALCFMAATFIPKKTGGYPWGLDVSVTAFGFLLLGNVLFPQIQAGYRFLKKGTKGRIICAVVMVLAAVSTMTYKLNVPYLSQGYVLMAEARYGNYLLFLLTSFLGILFMLSLAVLLDLILAPRGKISGMLTFIGANTMTIFAVHKLVIKAFRAVFNPIPFPAAVSVTLTVILTTAVCCGIALFLDRFLPAMIGKIPQKEVILKEDVKSIEQK